MPQLTVRFEDSDLQQMDALLRREGLETRSELLRRAWHAFRSIKQAESEGRVVLLTPAEQTNNVAIRLSI